MYTHYIYIYICPSRDLAQAAVDPRGELRGDPDQGLGACACVNAPVCEHDK